MSAQCRKFPGELAVRGEILLGAENGPRSTVNGEALAVEAAPHDGNTAFTVQRPSDISSGANEASPVFFTNHETRITVFLIPLGTEALQSFFSSPACIA